MGLRNGSATCYMNAVFQQLFMQPAVRAHVLSAPEVARKEQKESIFYQLQVTPVKWIVATACQSPGHCPTMASCWKQGRLQVTQAGVGTRCCRTARGCPQQGLDHV